MDISYNELLVDSTEKHFICCVFHVWGFVTPWEQFTKPTLNVKMFGRNYSHYNLYCRFSIQYRSWLWLSSQMKRLRQVMEKVFFLFFKSLIVKLFTEDICLGFLHQLFISTIRSKRCYTQSYVITACQWSLYHNEVI